MILYSKMVIYFVIRGIHRSRSNRCVFLIKWPLFCHFSTKRQVHFEGFWLKRAAILCALSSADPNATESQAAAALGESRRRRRRGARRLGPTNRIGGAGRGAAAAAMAGLDGDSVLSALMAGAQVRANGRFSSIVWIVLFTRSLVQMWRRSAAGGLLHRPQAVAAVPVAAGVPGNKHQSIVNQTAQKCISQY